MPAERLSRELVLGDRAKQRVAGARASRPSTKNLVKFAGSSLIREFGCDDNSSFYAQIVRLGRTSWPKETALIN